MFCHEKKKTEGKFQISTKRFGQTFLQWNEWKRVFVYLCPHSLSRMNILFGVAPFSDDKYLDVSVDQLMVLDEHVVKESSTRLFLFVFVFFLLTEKATFPK